MEAEPFCLCFSEVDVHLSSELLAGSYGQLTSMLVLIVLIVCSDLGRESQWSIKITIHVHVQWNLPLRTMHKRVCLHIHVPACDNTR